MRLAFGLGLSPSPVITPAITLESLLAEAGAADWDVSADVFQLADGTVAGAQGEAVRYIGDHTGHGLHATASDRGGVLKLRATSVPIIENNQTTDTFQFPAAIQGTTGTFVYETLTGKAAILMDAGVDMPRYQFTRACWFPRVLSAGEKAAALAGMNRFAIYRTGEQFNDLLNPSAGYFAFLGGDYEDIGATITFDWETSDSVTVPPWSEAATAYPYMSYVTGRTPREYFDTVVSNDATLKAYEIGWFTAGDHLQMVQDLTQWPALEAYNVVAVGLSGELDVSGWPVTLRGYNIHAGNGWVCPEGRWPDFSTAANKLVIEQFGAMGMNLTGAADLTPLVNCTSVAIVAYRTTSIDVSGLTALNNFLVLDCTELHTLDAEGCTSLPDIFTLNGCPALKNVNIKDCAIDQAHLNTILVKLDSYGLSNGNIDARVAAGVKASGAGATAVTAMLGRGYTITENP